MASVLGAFNSSRILMTRPELPLFPFNGSFVIFPKKKCENQQHRTLERQHSEDNGGNVCVYQCKWERQQ
jgi:hypothetical protein